MDSQMSISTRNWNSAEIDFNPSGVYPPKSHVLLYKEGKVVVAQVICWRQLTASVKIVARFPAVRQLDPMIGGRLVEAVLDAEEFLCSFADMIVDVDVQNSGCASDMVTLYSVVL